MIEEIIGWFHNYVSYYFTDIVLFLLVGFVFIRCRSIGYAYSAVLVLAFIFISYVGGYAMPQRDIAVVIFLGTVAGGWRYVAHARSSHHSFGFPFFRWQAPKLWSFGALFERFETFQAQRRYNKVYVEEFAREQAKQGARGSNSHKSDGAPTGNRSERSRSSQKRDPRKPQKKKPYSRTQSDQKTKQEQRKERFNRSRSKASPNATATPTTRTPLEILGLNSGFTQAELRERYRKLASQYHPDKFENMSDTVKQEMSAEFVAVKQAYERLKQ